MALIAMGAEDLQRALELWSEALSLAMETQNAEGVFHVAGTLGSILARIGQKEDAKKLLGLAEEAGLNAGFPQVGQVQAMLRALFSQAEFMRHIPMARAMGKNSSAGVNRVLIRRFNLKRIRQVYFA